VSAVPGDPELLERRWRPEASRADQADGWMDGWMDGWRIKRRVVVEVCAVQNEVAGGMC